jgi:ribonuclease HI
MLRESADVSIKNWFAPAANCLCGMISQAMATLDAQQRAAQEVPASFPSLRKHHRFRSRGTLLACFDDPTNSLTLAQLLKGVATRTFSIGANVEQLTLTPCGRETVTQELLADFATLIARHCLALRQQRLPAPHRCATKAMHWNCCSLQDWSSDEAKVKLRAISGHLIKGPVFLTETKWDATMDQRSITALHGTNTFSTPALRSDSGNGGASGGVAAIFPTAIHPQQLTRHEIVPGRALHVAQAFQGGDTHWVAIYCPPGLEWTILKQVSTYLKGLAKGRLYLCGDFNQAPKHTQKWEHFLAEHGLQDLTGPQPTFFSLGDSKLSALDKWLVRDVALTQHRLTCKVRPSKLSMTRTEHAKLSIILRPTPVVLTDAPMFQAIPPAACNQGFPPAQELARLLETLPPEDTSQRFHDKLEAAAWAWWRNLPRGTYDHLSKPSHLLRKLGRQRGDFIQVPLATLQAAIARINLPLDVSQFPPGRNGTRTLPRDTVLSLLEALDLEDMQECIFLNAPSELKATMGHNTVPRIWARIKTLAPKAAGTLSHLLTKEGTLLTSPAEVEKEVRSTRPFWTCPSPPLAQELLELLPEYATTAPVLSHIPPPGVEVIQQVLHKTGDSAPGIDGLPYALYRLIPETTALCVTQLLEDLTLHPHLIRPPNPLLVWIPKASEGLKADNWRPLGLPTCFLRITSAAVYTQMQASLPALLHPSQALLNSFREPQGNFSDAHHFLRKPCGTSSPLTSVVLTDYMKAFELVNPRWILAVLEARQAPIWLLKYATFILGGRRVTPKIMNRLMKALNVLVGVDMGAALSPLLFCLAMDPLLTYLNRIPRILLVRAYMDDNQSGGKGTAWLQEFQTLCDKFSSAGLVMVLHTCCLFIPLGAGNNLILPNPPGSSWLRAARQALAAAPAAKRFAVGHTQEVVSRADLQKLCCNLSNTWLCHLIAAPCSCKTKTTYLPARRLTPQELRLFDLLPWGAKPLAGHAEVLGLPLASSARMILPIGPVAGASLPCKTRFQGKQLRQMTHAIEHKIELKAKLRAGLLAKTITPIPQRAIAHCGWIQSLSYYSSSVFQKTRRHVKRLTTVYAKLVLGTHWIKGDGLAELLAALKIASAPPLQRAQECAAIGLNLRRLGGERLITGLPRLPKEVKLRTDPILNRWRIQLPYEAWRAVQTTMLDTPPGSSKACAKSLYRIKKALRKHETAQALQLLSSATAQVRWQMEDKAHGWQVLANSIHRDFSPIGRIAVLKWMLNRDADDRLRWHNTPHQGRHDPCWHCGAPGTIYPYGRQHTCACHAHAQLSTFWICRLPASLREALAEFCSIPPVPPLHIPLAHKISAPNPGCIFCRESDNTVEHWLNFCPFTLAITSAVLGSPMNPQHWLTGDKKSILLHGHIIHGLRREVLARKGLSHHRYGEPVQVPSMDLRKVFLGVLRDITKDLPFELQHLRTLVGGHSADKQSSCPSCYSAVLRGWADPLNPAVSRHHLRPRARLFSGDVAAPGQLLLCVHSDSYLRQGATTPEGWLPPPQVSTLHTANCTASICTCDCGERVTKLIATSSILLGEELTLAVSKDVARGLRHLIVQFDGSCLRPDSGAPAAGAGIVFWELSQTGLRLLQQLSTPLPEAHDSQQAEALAASIAVLGVVKKLDEWNPDTIEIQGDNKAIIGVWNGTCRFHGARLNSMIQEARSVARYQLSSLLWTYIPRERNVTADELAGIASRWLAAMRSPFVSITDAPGTIDAHLDHLHRWLPEWEIPIDDPEAALRPNPAQAVATLEQIPAFPLMLWEKVDLIDWGLTALLIQQNPEKHSRNVQALFTALMHKRSNRPLPTIHVPKTVGPTPYGRRYAQGPSLCNLSHDMRTLLIGDSHWELDLEGSHYGIFLCLLRVHCLGDIPGEWSTVENVRAMLTAVLTPPGGPLAPLARQDPRCIKRLPNMLLNKTREAALRQAPSWFNAGFVPSIIRDWILWMHAAKTALLASAVPKPPPNEKVVANVNDMYYLLEFHEGLIMSRVAAGLLRATHIDSLLWLHDGIVFSPSIPDHIIQHTVQEALHFFQLQGLRFKCQSLREERQRIIDRLPPPSTVTSDTKRRLYSRSLPPNFKRVRPLLDSAVAQITHTAKRAKFLGTDQQTLHKFFARKRKADAL